MKYTLGLIGTGHMGSALIRAISKNTKSILIHDHNQSKMDLLVNECGVEISADKKKLIENCRFVMLGIKPQGFPELLNEIRDAVQANKKDLILVSMAAGYQIKSIEEVIGEETKIIRIMPNLPVALGQGVVLVCHNKNVSDQEVNEFKQLLKGSGSIIDLKEEQFNAGCALSGSGPAFVYSFINGLAKAARDVGIDYETSKQMAIQTCIGSSMLMQNSDKTPEELIDSVCSKGGTTIEGVQVLKQNNFDEILKKTIEASYQRGEELANKK